MKQNGWLTDKAWLALWVFGLSLVSGTDSRFKLAAGFQCVDAFI